MHIFQKSISAGFWIVRFTAYMEDTYANNTHVHPSEVITTMNGYVCTYIGADVFEKQMKQYQTMVRGKRIVKLSLQHDHFRRLKTVDHASKIPTEGRYIDNPLTHGISNNGPEGGSATVVQALAV